MAEFLVSAAAAAGTAAAAEAGTRLATKGKTVIEHARNFEEIVEDVKARAQTLEAEKVDLQNLIDASLNNNEVIKESVTNWLQRVNTVLQDARKLSDEATEIKQRWHKGWPYSRSDFGRKAMKKIGVIEQLLAEKSGFVSMGDPKPFQSLDIVTDGDFEAFASREDTTKKVVGALQNNQVRMIGIFGMPGVGKTMLMRAIRKQAKDDKLFDEVVMVIVSQKPDISAIQKDIAEQLDLDLGGSSKVVAATKLSERLNQGKKVLVALDDVWDRLEMKEIGIPYKSNVHGCKVLFTTRSEGVCVRMEVQEKIEVGVLADSDAWELFLQKVGPVVDSFSDQKVVSDVFNECKGLPLAIVTLGLALRDKDEDEWIDARTQLKESIYKDMGPVISMVKLSYDFLHEYKAAQMCFLFCSLFPEDFQIETDVLLNYMLGEDLLENVTNMEKARKRLHAVVKRLTSSGILLRSEGGAIMMHDVIRDAAIRIASHSEEGEGFIVKSGLGLEEWSPIDGDMEKCKRLSLMSNNLTWKGLPTHISASLLLTLSLSRNPDLEEIPSDFFKEMKQLKTLDLSETCIHSLPESFRCLESLRTLLMDRCYFLFDISLVGELERLEILSIYMCMEIEIPSVSMRKLRMLNASGVNTPFPPKTISSLQRLEELYLDGRGMERESVISEVASLTRLTSLAISLPVECLLRDFPTHWKNLSSFSISVGPVVSRTESGLIKADDFLVLMRRSMYLNLGSSAQDLASSIRISNWVVGVLLEKTEYLELKECNHLLTVADLNANGFYPDLSILVASSCPQLTHLLSTTNARMKSMFSNLEVLRLNHLEKFVAICDGPIPEGFLCKLKKLEVGECFKLSPILIPFDLLGNLQKLEKLKLWRCWGLEKVVELKGFSMSKQPHSSLIFPSLRIIEITKCDKLKCVIPLKAARHLLQQLESLIIFNCSAMEMIFEGDDGDKATLPRLKELNLAFLPSLSSFGPPGLLFDFPALIEMTVQYCRNLKRLPLLGKQSIPKLKKLTVNTRRWLDGLEWDDESLKHHMKSLH